jgi:hypothetical protein
MLKGEKIKVGGEEMVLPPLNLDDVEAYWAELLDGSLAKNPKGIAAIFHAALVRNYPALTIEEFKKKMSPGELMMQIPILMKQSGFLVGEPGKGSKSSQTGSG